MVWADYGRPRSKIGMAEAGDIDILNLKTDKSMKMLLQSGKGILPAYHMNKESWISIAPNGSVDDEIRFLIDTSYRLTL